MGCMPKFCRIWPFFSTDLTSKVLVFMLLLIARDIIEGRKTSSGKAQIFPDVSIAVTLSLGLETGLSRLINTM